MSLIRGYNQKESQDKTTHTLSQTVMHDSIEGNAVSTWQRKKIDLEQPNLNSSVNA